MEHKLVNNWTIIFIVIHVRGIMYKSSSHFIYCIIWFKNGLKPFSIWVYTYTAPKYLENILKPVTSIVKILQQSCYVRTEYDVCNIFQILSKYKKRFSKIHYIENQVYTSRCPLLEYT